MPNRTSQREAIPDRSRLDPRLQMILGSNSVSGRGNWVMKPAIPVLATAIVLAFSSVPAGAAASKHAQASAMGQVHEVSSHRKRHRYFGIHSRRHVYVLGPFLPQACRSVLFPRSPLCAGQVATFYSYYGGY